MSKMEPAQSQVSYRGSVLPFDPLSKKKINTDILQYTVAYSNSLYFSYPGKKLDKGATPLKKFSCASMPQQFARMSLSLINLIV